MTRLQFWILTGTSLFVSALFLYQIYAGRQAQASSLNFNREQQLINEGQTSYARFRQVAARTYQLSQQDPALKSLLARQQINITVQAPSDSTGSETAPVAVPSNVGRNRTN